MKLVTRPSQALDAAAKPQAPILRLVENTPAHPEGFMSQKAYDQYLEQKRQWDDAEAIKKTFGANSQIPQQQQDRTSFMMQHQQQQQQVGIQFNKPKTP